MREYFVAKRGKDDNIISAMAHACVIFAPVIGPAAIWLIYKDKSKYVRFQAFQALTYQLTMTLAQISSFFTMFTLWLLIIGILFLPLFLFLWIFGIVYGLYAAYKTFIGENFRYLLVGEWAEKALK